MFNQLIIIILYASHLGFARHVSRRKANKNRDYSILRQSVIISTIFVCVKQRK